MSAAFVEAIGLLAPGLPSWEAGRDILSGAQPYVGGVLPSVQASLLPPNEQRRAPLGVRMALRVAGEALGASSVPASELASLFATSEADLEILHRICSALAEPERAVSPTDFHNSVHNAASGYWAIAAGARRGSTTLAAYDFSLAAGLREAIGMLSVDDTDLLLALFDVPPPAPLYATRPISSPFAVALILTRAKTARSCARLELTASKAETTLSDSSLESLRKSNPAARALPLLELIAARRAGVIGLPASEVQPLGLRVDMP